MLKRRKSNLGYWGDLLILVIFSFLVIFFIRVEAIEETVNQSGEETQAQRKTIKDPSPEVITNLEELRAKLTRAEPGDILVWKDRRGISLVGRNIPKQEFIAHSSLFYGRVTSSYLDVAMETVEIIIRSEKPERWNEVTQGLLRDPDGYTVPEN